MQYIYFFKFLTVFDMYSFSKYLPTLCCSVTVTLVRTEDPTVDGQKSMSFGADILVRKRETNQKIINTA